MRLQVENIRLRRVVLCAFLILFAFALSYIEHIIPFELFIPLPGVKLGLANIAVILAFVYISPLAGVIVSMMRVFLSFLFFGSPIGFAFSLGGASISLCVLFILILTANDRVSFVGVSVLSATAHGFGQIVVGTFIFGTLAIIGYLPVLLLFGVAFGCLTGIVLNLMVSKCDRAAVAFGFERGKKRNES